MLCNDEFPESLIANEPRCVDVIGAFEGRFGGEGDSGGFDGEQGWVRVLGCVECLLCGEIVEVGRGLEGSDELET